MKHKFLTIAFTLLAVLCLGAGLAACGGNDNSRLEYVEPTITVGTTVKKLASAPFKGVVSSNEFGLLTMKGDYAGNRFDYKDRYITPDRMVKAYYRNGAWFTQENLGNVNTATPWEEAEFEPLTYTADMPNRVEPNGRAAAYGVALMLSVKENNAINNNLKYQKEAESNPSYDYSDFFKKVPENGVWTGELTLSGIRSYDSDEDFVNYSSRKCESLADLVDYMSFFKYAAAPFTQDQFIELFTALSELEGEYKELGSFCGSILAAGKPSAGQSAFDYFRGAWREMHKGQDAAAFEALKTENPDEYGDMDFETYLVQYSHSVRDAWRELPNAALALAIGKEVFIGSGDFLFYFDKQGNLTGAKMFNSSDNPVDDIQFTATAPELDNIDDIKITYVEQGFSSDTVTCADDGWAVQFTLGGEDKAKTIESLDSISIEGCTAAAKLGAFEKEITYMVAPMELTIDGRTAKGTFRYKTNSESVYWDIRFSYADLCKLFEQEADPDDIPSEDAVTLFSSTIYADRAVSYHGTVADFVEKPLSEIERWDTIPYRVFQEKLYGQPYSDYAYYVDGEKIAEAAYLYEDGKLTFTHGNYIKTLFDEPWAPDSWIYFRQEEDGLWAYKHTYKAGWKVDEPRLCKMKMERPPLLTDYKHYLSYLSQDEFYSAVRILDGKAVFDLNGITYHYDLNTFVCTFEIDGITVEARPESLSYSSGENWGNAMEVSFTDMPDEEGWQRSMEDSAAPDSATLKKDGKLYELDFLNKKAKYNGEYFFMEDGVLKQLVSYDGTTWEMTDASYTEEEIFYYPLAALAGYTYDAFHYDPFDDMFYIEVEGTLYGVHLAGWAGFDPRADYVFIRKPDERFSESYFISKTNKTIVTLPQVTISQADVEQAVEDSFRAASYEVKISVAANNFMLDEKIDFNNQIIYMTVTNANGDAPINLYRAVSENRCWLYSDASGAWLRAETKGDPATLISAANELSGLKAALDELRSSSSYTIPRDEYSDTYTIGDYTITVENGYIASLRHGKGLAAVNMTFSQYNNASLTLPALGAEDAAAKEKFITAMNNTIYAANFHVDWEMNGATYSSDVVAGEKALTKISTNAGGQTTVIGEIYREVNGSKVDMWTRQRSTMLTWGSWSKSSYSGTEEEIKTDMFLQNVVFAATLGSTPDLVYILSKYDAATDTYTMRDFNFATMNVVESTFRIEGGYVTEWTTKSKDLLAALGVTGDSLTFRYSNFGNTWVTKPAGIS